MNSKFKCTFCGEYNRTDTGFKNVVGKFCNKKCAFEHYIKSNSKYKSAKRIPANKVYKNDHTRIDDIDTRQAAAVRICHTYIKMRDRDRSCICCNNRLNERYHAGHFLKAGSHSFIKFHKDNIHGQNYNCNILNGGDSGDYEVNLIKRIGKEKVDWLKNNRHKSIKRTAEDYLEIEKFYKAKILELKNETL